MRTFLSRENVFVHNLKYEKVLNFYFYSPINDETVWVLIGSLTYLSLLWLSSCDYIDFGFVTVSNYKTTVLGNLGFQYIICLICLSDSSFWSSYKTVSSECWKGRIRLTAGRGIQTRSNPIFYSLLSCGAGLTTQSFTNNVWAHYRFCNPENLTVFGTKAISIKITPKESKRSPDQFFHYAMHELLNWLNWSQFISNTILSLCKVVRQWGETVNQDVSEGRLIFRLCLFWCISTDAIVSGHHGVAEHLKARGGTFRECKLAQLMTSAASTGDTKTLKRLIRWTSHVNVSDFDGQTALHTAAMYGRLNIVNLLLKEGAGKVTTNGQITGILTVML